MKETADSRLYEEYLTRIAWAYIHKNFRDIYELFDKDIVWESNWVIEPRTGYDTVVKYYEEKGRLMREGPCETHHTLVKTLDPLEADIRGGRGNFFFIHESDKLMDYAVQISDSGRVSDVIVDIRINSNKLIFRIDMCIPELFSFTYYKHIN